MQLRLWRFSFEIDMRRSKKGSHHHHPFYFTLKKLLLLHTLYFFLNFNYYVISGPKKVRRANEFPSRPTISSVGHVTEFINSIDMCGMRRFLALLRSFFRSSLLYTLSFHTFPPTNLPSSLNLSFLLFLGLPLKLVSKFIYNTFLGILFSSTLCTCPNQRNLFNLIVPVLVGF